MSLCHLPTPSKRTKIALRRSHIKRRYSTWEVFPTALKLPTICCICIHTLRPHKHPLLPLTPAKVFKFAFLKYLLPSEKNSSRTTSIEHTQTPRSIRMSCCKTSLVTNDTHLKSILLQAMHQIKNSWKYRHLPCLPLSILKSLTWLPNFDVPPPSVTTSSWYLGSSWYRSK